MDFGFHIAPSSTIDLDKVDRSRIDAIMRLEPDFAICMACGSCSATCPAGAFSGMSIRKMILALDRGRDKDLPDMLDCCMLCGKCMMVCPRGINTRHLILSVCRVYGKKEAKR